MVQLIVPPGAPAGGPLQVPVLADTDSKVIWLGRLSVN